MHKWLSAHTGNSSNPIVLEKWTLFRFATVQDAKNIETLTKNRLRELGFAFRNKKELFKCSPTEATDIVEKFCAKNKLFALKNFPFNLNEALNTFTDFPCLPEDALEICAPLQRKLYWKGVNDTLRCLGYMEGIMLSRREIHGILKRVEGNEELNSELWTAIIDFYRNQMTFSEDTHNVTAAKKLAWTALEKIKTDRRLAFNDWQKLDDDDEELTAA